MIKSQYNTSKTNKIEIGSRMLTMIQTIDALKTPAGQTHDNQDTQSSQIDTLARLTVDLAVLKKENKFLKATIKGRRMPPVRSAWVTLQAGNNSDREQDQSQRVLHWDMLVNTGPILGKQEDVISLIRWLNTSIFEEYDEAEEILSDLHPTVNNSQIRRP